MLTHDKPGCGESPGDWLTQTFADRAHESLAALAVLRDHPAVSGRPVGLVGFSQGGWVSLLAGTLDEGRVDFIVSLSGPGVGTAEQDRDRIERELRARGTAEADVAEALGWIDERTQRLLAFIESAYDAGADLAGWDRADLESSWCPTPGEFLQPHVGSTSRGRA